MGVTLERWLLLYGCTRPSRPIDATMALVGTQKLLSSGEYVQSQKKVSFFREAIGVVRNRDDMLQGRKPVDIRRDHLVDDVFEKFGAFTAEDFKGSLFIKFVGEEGVDQGGLLSNMYNEVTLCKTNICTWSVYICACALLSCLTWD